MSNQSSQNSHIRTEALPTLVANIDLHPQAGQRAKEYVDHFSDSLLMQSKALALSQRANVVLSTHVDDARKIIITREQNTGRLREMLLIAGSGMLGTFLQGFPLEMATNPIRKKHNHFERDDGYCRRSISILGFREEVLATVVEF